MTTHTGSCKCGNVRVALRGGPVRVGICHCTDCRQESGSAFTFFAVWPANEFECEGTTSELKGRQFCPNCGSRLFSANEDEAEIKLGSLTEAPTPLVPTYELWVKRRERWLGAIDGADQYDEDRPSRT